MQAETRQERIRLGEAGQGSDRRRRPSPYVLHTGERPGLPVTEKTTGIGVRQSAHHAQAETDGEPVLPVGRLQGAVPSAGVDADRPDIDSVLTCVPHDLGRGVEAHRLGIQKRCAEDIGMVAFEPGGGVGDQGEGGRVAFGKAVGPEALQLAEGLFGELRGVAALDHAGDELVLEMADAAGELEGGHGAAELVGFGGREPGAFDGDAHGLFLEQRHPQGFAEHLFQFGLGIDDRLPAFPPAQIGVHHVALDRAGPDDGDLDDQIVEGARLDAGQHGHLRPAFDLEHPQGVRLADHGVGLGILRRDGGQVQIDPLVFGQQVQTAPHATEHAERQDIDLHELQGVDVVLVPFDHLAIIHRSRLDGDEIVEPVLGQDEAAGVLAEMAREADQLARQV